MSTLAVENYLVAIYTLESEGQQVIGARLAEMLKVKPSTITATIRRLARDGQVTIQPGKRIAFTEQGRRQVEGLIRRHRLAERWLTDVLGMGWHECHQDAHRLEHALSVEVADRLSRSLGNPSTCPHGNPIPGNPKPKTAAKLFLLSDARPGQVVTIARVSELTEDFPAFLRYLEDHGLRPGAALQVVEVETVGGLLNLSVGGKRITVSQKVAARIWVHDAGR